jgi:hypothetical protein
LCSAIRELFRIFFGLGDTWKERQPRRAALIAAMSIFFMPIIASNAQSFPHSQDNVHTTREEALDG